MWAAVGASTREAVGGVAVVVRLFNAKLVLPYKREEKRRSRNEHHREGKQARNIS